MCAHTGRKALETRQNLQRVRTTPTVRTPPHLLQQSDFHTGGIVHDVITSSVKHQEAHGFIATIAAKILTSYMYLSIDCTVFSVDQLHKQIIA